MLPSDPKNPTTGCFGTNLTEFQKILFQSVSKYIEKSGITSSVDVFKYFKTNEIQKSYAEFPEFYLKFGNIICN